MYSLPPVAKETPPVTKEKHQSSPAMYTPVKDPHPTAPPVYAQVNKSASMDSFVRHRNRSPMSRKPGLRYSQPILQQEADEIASDRSNNNSPVSFGNGANNFNGMGAADRKPAIPPRKPRMGQSSLSPNPVLPVTSASRFDTHNNNRGSSPARALWAVRSVVDPTESPGDISEPPPVSVHRASRD